MLLSDIRRFFVTDCHLSARQRTVPEIRLSYCNEKRRIFSYPPYIRLPNSPDLNRIDYCVWGVIRGWLRSLFIHCMLLLYCAYDLYNK